MSAGWRFPKAHRSPGPGVQLDLVLVGDVAPEPDPALLGVLDVDHPLQKPDAVLAAGPLSKLGGTPQALDGRSVITRPPRLEPLFDARGQLFLVDVMGDDPVDPRRALVVGPEDAHRRLGHRGALQHQADAT